MQLNRWKKNKQKTNQGGLKLWGSQRWWIAGKQRASRHRQNNSEKEMIGGGQLQTATIANPPASQPPHAPTEVPGLPKAARKM